MPDPTREEMIEALRSAEALAQHHVRSWDEYPNSEACRAAAKQLSGIQAALREIEAGGWRPIESAPKDGTTFLALQEGEIFLAHYTKDPTPRLCYRMHALRVEEHYRIIKTELDGRKVEARVPLNEPWRELYEHNWVLWTRGYDFSPTAWMPAPPAASDGGEGNG